MKPAACCGAFALAAFAACIAHAAGTTSVVARYVCKMNDGSVRVTAQNLSEMFSKNVAQCQEVDTAAAAAQAVPLPPMATTGLSDRLQRALGRTPPSPARLRQLPSTPQAYAGLIEEACRRQQIDPALVTALIYVESRFRPEARSPKGALGLMQLMPGTAARYGVLTDARLMDPAVNIDIGTRYLRDLSDLFDGRMELVLAAYNAGEGAVMTRGNVVPPFPETQAYVKNIMAMLGLTPRTRWVSSS